MMAAAIGVVAAVELREIPVAVVRRFLARDRPAIHGDLISGAAPVHGARHPATKFVRLPREAGLATQPAQRRVWRNKAWPGLSGTACSPAT